VTPFVVEQVSPSITALSQEAVEASQKLKVKLNSKCHHMSVGEASKVEATKENTNALLRQGISQEEVDSVLVFPLATTIISTRMTSSTNSTTTGISG